jgi:hypothetical protein
MHVWNGDPEEHDPGRDHTYTSDFFLMDFLAAKLRKLALDLEAVL